METNLETWTRERLISRIYDLEAMVESLKTAGSDNKVLSVKVRFKLTFTQARLLTALSDGRPKTKRALYEFVYHDEFDNAPEMRIIDVFMVRIRRKVSVFGLSISTIQGRGFQLSDPKLFEKVLDGTATEIDPSEIAVKAKPGEANEKAMMSFLTKEMDSACKVRMLGRNIAKQSGISSTVGSVMKRLEKKKMVKIIVSPKAGMSERPWIVLVRAPAR